MPKKLRNFKWQVDNLLVKQSDVQLYFRPSFIPSLEVVKCCLPGILGRAGGSIGSCKVDDAEWLVTAAVRSVTAGWAVESAGLHMGQQKQQEERAVFRPG